MSLLKAKKLLAPLLFGMELGYLKQASLARKKFVVLMYHRILRQNEIAGEIESGMYVERDTFDKHMKFVKRNFEPVSFSNWLKFTRTERLSPSGKPYCIVTFDDGWLDFYRNAYPILLRYEIPATVFLPTDFIGSTKWFWTDRLARMFAKKKSSKARTMKRDLAYPELRTILRLTGNHEKTRERIINLLKTKRLEIIEEILTALSELWEIELPVGERAFLNWEEVRELYNSGLIQFGSHTQSHPILTTLSKEEVVSELENSRNRLDAAGIIDLENLVFCYPNGSYDSDIRDLVKKIGYKAAVTTRPGWNSYGDDPFELNRIGVHQDVTSTIPMYCSRILTIF